jgi:uncharacterized protein (DUF1697 family)
MPAKRTTRQVGLLRAVNLGSRNRLGMADLRAAVEALGYGGVQTHLQSGNVVFATDEKPAAAADRIRAALAERAGLDVEVLVRTSRELATVVERDPLREHVTDPRRYLVAFLSARPDPARLRQLDAEAYAPERFHAAGREVYVWVPDGVHRARLTHAFLERKLGVVATARNWNTVEKLLELAGA